MYRLCKFIYEIGSLVTYITVLNNIKYLLTIYNSLNYLVFINKYLVNLCTRLQISHVYHSPLFIIIAIRTYQQKYQCKIKISTLYLKLPLHLIFTALRMAPIHFFNYLIKWL